jgi:hypothetical protein
MLTFSLVNIGNNKTGRKDRISAIPLIAPLYSGGRIGHPLVVASVADDRCEVGMGHRNLL